MEKAIQLIDDIILLEKKKDAQFKSLAMLANKASLAQGESSTIFHLKQLKEMLSNIYFYEKDWRQ